VDRASAAFAAASLWHEFGDPYEEAQAPPKVKLAPCTNEPPLLM
jgi:hypothetical protein